MQLALVLLLIVCQAESATPAPRGTTGAPAGAARCAARAHVPLGRLRARMTNLTGQRDSLNAYIVPSLDEHQSESPGAPDRRLWYASGWDGSGWAVVLAMTGAALWTDAAAVPLARARLSCEWSVFAADGPNATSLVEWLQINIDGARRVGADNRLIPHSTWKEWAEEMGVHRMTMVATPELLDQVWEADGRPPPPKAQVYTQNAEYAGKSWQTKVAELRNELRAVGADAMVVTALDETAWLLNIRGKDALYSPVVKCYLLVTQRDLHLYIPPGKLSIEARRNLNADGCFNTNCTKVHDYNEIWRDLRLKTQPWEYILLPAPSSFYPGVSEAIYSNVPEMKRMHKTSPIIHMKAVKNSKEIEGMRKAHIRDSATFCEILAFLEKEMKKGEVWDEIKVIKLIDTTRESQALSRGLSFQSIVAFGANGAIPHYIADNRTSRVITRNSTIVIDSGGQYDDGTTDVTRTLHFGKPTAEHKKSYTLVLMACIELARMEFPASLRISDVDIIPRTVLWQSHKNYLHSTGHGVGSFLHVHEDPINVLYHHRQKLNFKPGQFFSNEPGIYEEGNFGVRLENILEVINAPAKSYPDQDGPYLAFRDITLVPYEPKLIEYNMLTLYQRRWLNEYNLRIRQVIGAELKQQMQMDAYYWMMNKTFHIPEDDIFRRYAAGAVPMILPKLLIGIFVLITILPLKILM